MKLAHVRIVLIALSGAVVFVPGAVPCKFASRVYGSISERQVAFVSSSGVRSGNPFLQAHSWCPHPQLRVIAPQGKSTLHCYARRRRVTRTPATEKAAMQNPRSSDKNLGTASCDLPLPADVVGASLAQWLELNDKDGSRAGKLRVLSVDMDGTIADTRERQRFAEEKSGVGEQKKRELHAKRQMC